jgi:hypothetical protein
MSNYERLQIDSILGRSSTGPALPGRIERGMGLVLLPAGEAGEIVHRMAIEPALDSNGINVRDMRLAFDQTASLALVVDWIRRAEIIVAELSDLNPCVLYVLGLCNGLGRCPILIADDQTQVPFNLDALRLLRFQEAGQGLFTLRAELTRAVRVFLAMSRADHDVT